MVQMIDVGGAAAAGFSVLFHTKVFWNKQKEVTGFWIGRITSDCVVQNDSAGISSYITLLFSFKRLFFFS